MRGHWCCVKGLGLGTRDGLLDWSLSLIGCVTLGSCLISLGLCFHNILILFSFEETAEQSALREMCDRMVG